MKKQFILLSGIFLFGQLLYGQQHIHWGSTGDPKNGLTITWQSTGTEDQIKWGYSASYEQGTFSGIRRNDYLGYLYNYSFPAVNPSSVIHYSIFSNGLWIPDKIFRTSVDPASTKFTFMAAGDSRTNLNDWDSAAKKLDADSADFFLFLGDHVAEGDVTVDWDNWYVRGAKFIENNLIYHTGGNHEYGPIYLNQFVMPGNENWYSFEFGNVLFICLLSENLFTNSSVQHAWLMNELSASTKKWKVIFFHKPFFTMVHIGDMIPYANTWWKAFDDYGVDVVLGAHAHYYLRTPPINLNISNTAPVAEYGSNPGQGRLQIVTGSIGAPLYGSASAWFVEKNISTMNYTKFFMNGDILKMIAYDLSGTIIDSVTINKQTTAISDSETKPVTEFELRQNYPNPFTVSTTIMYHLETPKNITLKIFDITGKEIETLAQGFQSAGDHQINWQPDKLKSGIYFYRLEALDPSAGSVKRFSETKKLMLLK